MVCPCTSHCLDRSSTLSHCECQLLDGAGAPKGSAEALLVALQELQAEAEALARDAEQLTRDAVAFEQPEPQFAQLPALQVKNTRVAFSKHASRTIMFCDLWCSVVFSELETNPWKVSFRVQEDINATLEAWSVYGGFAQEMAELLALPWLEARKHVHRVEDFVTKWSKQVEGMGKSAMKLAILRDVDGFRKCVLQLTQSTFYS